MKEYTIRSTEEFICRVREDRPETHPWFRGEPNVETPLVPKVYRETPGRQPHDENRLLQFFRMKAPTFSTAAVPTRHQTDQWLLLQQHVGLPTRLLDWTESALVALRFALLKPAPVVWMLDPLRLNKLSENDSQLISGGCELPLTWFNPEEGINIGSINIRGA